MPIGIQVNNGWHRQSEPIPLESYLGVKRAYYFEISACLLKDHLWKIILSLAHQSIVKLLLMQLFGGLVNNVMTI